MVGKVSKPLLSKTKFYKNNHKTSFQRLYYTRPHKIDVLITKSERNQKKKKKRIKSQKIKSCKT
jgi:hypothetical protein